MLSFFYMKVWSEKKKVDSRGFKHIAISPFSFVKYEIYTEQENRVK